MHSECVELWLVPAEVVRYNPARGVIGGASDSMFAYASAGVRGKLLASAAGQILTPARAPNI